jgi:hypothetical protein
MLERGGLSSIPYEELVVDILRREGMEGEAGIAPKVRTIG